MVSAAPTQPRPEITALLRSGRTRTQIVRERIISFVLLCCGLLSIVVTLAIAAVILYGSFEFFTTEDGVQMGAGAIWDRVVEFFTGTAWTAGFDSPKYGILPLLVGTLWVAAVAAAIALPIGLTTAIYLSEYAHPRTRAWAKPTLELLAGIPTVVYGFFAISTITPFLGTFIPGLGDPTNVLSGGIVVGIMIIPMVASLSEDALRSVPRSLRDGAIALGANRFETSVKVVLPAALSGVTASFLLAISRAIGETMAVSLACGETVLKLSGDDWFWRLIDPRQGMATMTSFIVHVAKGEAEHGSTYFNSLFAVAGMLFFMTLFMNVTAHHVLRRYRQVYQ